MLHQDGEVDFFLDASSLWVNVSLVAIGRKVVQLREDCVRG